MGPSLRGHTVENDVSEINNVNQHCSFSNMGADIPMDDVSHGTYDGLMQNRYPKIIMETLSDDLNIELKALKLQHQRSNCQGQHNQSDPTTAMGGEDGSRNENFLGEPSNIFELSQ